MPGYEYTDKGASFSGFSNLMYGELVNLFSKVNGGMDYPWISIDSTTIDYSKYKKDFRKFYIGMPSGSPTTEKGNNESQKNNTHTVVL